MSVEYSSQATSTNPHFFGSHPPLDIFWRVVYNYFCCYFILAFGRSYDAMKILKFIIMLLRKIEKILHSGKWKICTGGVRVFALPSPKTRSEAVLLFNFSTPCQAQLLVETKIIRIWYFFLFCLLEISCNREGVLFANNFHLHFIIFWMMLLIQKYYYLRIIIICVALLFEYHNHLEIIIICE
mgnify:CR=1 FL=1